ADDEIDRNRRHRASVSYERSHSCGGSLVVQSLTLRHHAVVMGLACHESPSRPLLALRTENPAIANRMARSAEARRNEPQIRRGMVGALTSGDKDSLIEALDLAPDALPQFGTVAIPCAAASKGDALRDRRRVFLAMHP